MKNQIKMILTIATAVAALSTPAAEVGLQSTIHCRSIDQTYVPFYNVSLSPRNSPESGSGNFDIVIREKQNFEGTHVLVIKTRGEGELTKNIEFLDTVGHIGCTEMQNNDPSSKLYHCEMLISLGMSQELICK
jgi:hypothetical protein